MIASKVCTNVSSPEIGAILTAMRLPLNHIWQPARTSSEQLMIVLHGRGDSAEGFLWLRDALGIDTLDFLLLRAPNPYYTGFSSYDLPPNQLPEIIESRKLLSDALAKPNGRATRRIARSGWVNVPSSASPR